MSDYAHDGGASEPSSLSKSVPYGLKELRVMKVYQYQAVVIENRGHLTDPEYLLALCSFGKEAGPVVCPVCGLDGHATANGWKHREEQAVGATKLAILLEREVELRGCGGKT